MTSSARNLIGAEPTVESALARRGRRAEELARGSAAAKEPLQFAAGLYRTQARAAAILEAAHARRPLTGRLRDDFDRFASAAAHIVSFAAAEGPPVLAGEAKSRAAEDTAAALARLGGWWNLDGEAGRDDYLSRAVLRPYAEVLARAGTTPDRPLTPGWCPVCGGLPWIACRRPDAGADGSRRLLGCSLCGGEWPLGRIECPACGEEDPQKLPSFRSEQFPSVRIEACETCRRYVKSLDLTRDALAIPEVDDLVSLSMDLWAVEQGFMRLAPGLAGG